MLHTWAGLNTVWIVLALILMCSAAAVRRNWGALVGRIVRAANVRAALSRVMPASF